MNSSSLTSLYADLLLQFLSSPAGVTVIFAAALLAILAVVVPTTRWVIVCFAAYAATLPINAVGYVEGELYVPLAFPLEQIRLYSRSLTLGFLAMLVLPLVTSGRGWRQRLFTPGIVWMMIFHLMIALRLTIVGSGSRGPLSLASYGLLFLTFGLGVSLWLKGLDDVYKLIAAIAVSGGCVIAATCYQLAINRAPMIVNNRLTGMTGNPQFLALFIAFTLPAACVLMSRGRKWLRPLMAAQITVSVILLLWTGSRMGLLGTMAGVLVLYHRRLGRLAGVIVVVGLLVLLALPYFEGSTSQLQRFVWGVNTREGIWNQMLKTIAEQPWFGASRDTLAASESSYLSALAQLGIVGATPFFVACGLIAVSVFRLQRARAWMGDQQQLVDLVTAFWVSVAVTSVFEGYFLGVLVFPVLAVYLFGGLTAYLGDHIAFVKAQAEEDVALEPDPWHAAA